MKVKLLIVFLCFHFSMFYLNAADIYPGKSYGLESNFSVGGIVSPLDNKTGGAFFSGLSIRDLFPRTRFGLQLGYNYLQENNELFPMSTFSFNAAYGFAFNEFFTIWPTVESTVFIPFQSPTATGFSLGAVVDFHIFDRNYLSLEPMVSLPINSSLNPYFSFRVGVKHNFPVLRKLPAPKMKIVLNSSVITPGKDGVPDLLDIRVHCKNPDSFKNWRIFITDTQGNEKKSWSGTGAPLQSYLWDGLNPIGNSREITFEMNITVKAEDLLGNMYEEEESFSLIFPPTSGLSLTISPKLFSPDEDGVDDFLNIYINTINKDSLVSWKVSVVDEKGRELYTEYGSNTPPEHIQWNGTDDVGVLVSSATDYKVVLEYEDIYGKESSIIESFSTDIFIYEDNGKKKIRIPGIIFPPNSVDFSLLTEEEQAANIKIIKKLAVVLKKFADYKILIEGHGNLLSWENPELAEWEQEQELIPLSKRRADSVRHLLAAEGVSPDRLYILGAGGSNPLIPFQNEKDRWINRRVEFILLK